MKKFDRNPNVPDISAELGMPNETIEYDFVWRNNSEERRVFNEHLNELIRLGRSTPRRPLLWHSTEDFISLVPGTELLDTPQSTNNKGE